MTPNVLIRVHYYEKGSEGRDFYSSMKKDDYVNYIDKGVRQTSSYADYVDYADNKEKSSGIFDANGLVSAKDKKILREKLRKTDSTIWDFVISFKEEYGKQNCNSPEDARKLLTKVLPSFFKSVGLDSKKTTWYAGLHQNTDNRHIHLSFFQEEPNMYDRKTKGRKYRRGKLPLNKVDDLKIAIEKNYLSPIQGAKRVRNIILEETHKVVSKSYEKNKNSIGKLCQSIYDSLPDEDDLHYESKSIDKIRDDIDSLTSIIMEHEYIAKPYRKLMEDASKRDKEITSICQSDNIDPEPYLYVPKFEKDLKRRVGNAILKELSNKKKEERQKTALLHHPKAIQRCHMQYRKSLFDPALYFAKRASDIAWEAYLEYQRNLDAIEKGREEIEAEMNS